MEGWRSVSVRAGTMFAAATMLIGMSWTTALGQMHITATAVINPVQPKTADAGGVITHDLRFVLSWDSHVTSRLLTEAAPCGMTLGGIIYGSDSIVVSVPHTPAGQYCFEPQMGVTLPGQVTHAVFSIYLDGKLVRSETATTGSSESDVYIVWPSGGICYDTPYNSDFDFELLSRFFIGDPYVPEAYAENTCDSTAWSPSDPLTCEIISGSGSASFHDASTGARVGTSVTTTGDSLPNYILEFDGIYPDSISWVVLQATSDGLTKIDSVQISGRPVATVDPPEIRAGDTAAVNVVWHPVLSGPGISSVYEAGIISGGKYGTLLTGLGDTAAYLPYTGSPFRFIAASAIDSDSVRVGIRVGAGILIAGKASPGGKGKVIESTAGGNGAVRSAAQKAAVNGPKAGSGTAGSGRKEASEGTVSFMYPDYTVVYVEVLRGSEPKLVILQPTADSPDETISAVPKMPTVVCKAQLQNYNGGEVTYEWTYETADTFLQETPPSKNKPGLPLPPRHTGRKFTGQTTATGSAVSGWTVPFNTLFTGGKTELIVNATTSEGKSYKDTVNANSILGKNPSPNQIRSGLTVPQQVIVYMESYPKWYQFNESTRNSYNKDGNPIYGPPQGYGLMQLDNDPAATEQDLWKWQTNLNDGLSKFKNFLTAASRYATRVNNGKTWYKLPNGEWKPYDPVAKFWYGHFIGGTYVPIPYSNAASLTSDQILQEAFQRYNGGAYWRWYPDQIYQPWSSGKWEPDPPKGAGNDPTPYGDKAWAIYEDVLNNQPPISWGSN